MNRTRAIRATVPAAAGGVGFWLGLGAVAPDAAGTARIGVLAPWWVLVVLILTPVIVAALSERRAERVHAWWAGVAGALPWLPIPHVPALLLWQGPLMWTLLAGALAVMLWPRFTRPHATPARHMAAAVSIAFVCYVAAAWRMAPVLPGGDEPHYLIITQSLLHDRDLAIENNHRHREYLAYTAQPIQPDFLRRGIDGAIYSIHAPGISAIVAPAFAAGGYPGVVVLLAAIAALGSALVWRASWHATGGIGAAWSGWAAVSLSVPFFFQAFTVFPDGVGAVLVMAATYALVLPVRRESDTGAGAALTGQRLTAVELFAYGTAIAMLPWLHTRFSILAGVLGGVLALRIWRETRPVARVAALAAIPCASLVLWLSYFAVLYGTPNPAAPYGGYTQSSLSNAWRGMSGLLIDQQFGVLPNAPVYLVAFVGFACLLHARRRLAIELALIATPYAVAAASYHMWWGGRSTPARFIVPVLLPFGVAIAAAWQRAGRAARAAIATLLAGSIGITAILATVDGGVFAYNVRDGYALWLEWVAPVVRLPLAAPSLFRFGGALGTAWAQAGAWALAIVVGWMLLRKLPMAAAPAVVALVIAIGGTAGWMLAGIDAIDEGTGLWRVARAAARPGAVGVMLPSLRTAGAAALLRDLALPAPEPRLEPQGPLFAARAVPAGTYDIRLPADAKAGSVGVTVGRVPPFARAAVRDTDAIMRLDLPFGAASLRIDSLADRVAPPGSAALVPVKLARVPAAIARAAITSGRSTLWVLDNGGWAEPGGVWTRGRQPVTIAVDVNGPVPLGIRAGAVETTVFLTAGSWREEVRLRPRERRDVDVPVGIPRTPIAIAADRAFRPHDHDPASSDMRVLGVWVEVR